MFNESNSRTTKTTGTTERFQGFELFTLKINSFSLSLLWLDIGFRLFSAFEFRIMPVLRYPGLLPGILRKTKQWQI
jgi:hypothetical protein